MKPIVSKARVSLGLKPLDLTQGSVKGVAQPPTRNRYPSEQYTEIAAANTKDSPGRFGVKSAYSVDVDEYLMEDLEGTKAYRYWTLLRGVLRAHTCWC